MENQEKEKLSKPLLPLILLLMLVILLTVIAFNIRPESKQIPLANLAPIPVTPASSVDKISVDNGKGPNWSYTNKILENWHTSGVKTVEDAENTIAKNKDRLSMSSFDTDDFFEAALKRSNERIKERSKK